MSSPDELKAHGWSREVTAVSTTFPLYFPPECPRLEHNQERTRKIIAKVLQNEQYPNVRAMMSLLKATNISSAISRKGHDSRHTMMASIKTWATSPSLGSSTNTILTNLPIRRCYGAQHLRINEERQIGHYWIIHWRSRSPDLTIENIFGEEASVSIVKQSSSWRPWESPPCTQTMQKMSLDSAVSFKSCKGLQSCVCRKGRRALKVQIECYLFLFYSWKFLVIIVCISFQCSKCKT